MQTYLKRAIVGTIRGLRPLLGPATCRFEMGCTQYAVEQLEKHSLMKAIRLITWRLIACSPINGILGK